MYWSNVCMTGEPTVEKKLCTKLLSGHRSEVLPLRRPLCLNPFGCQLGAGYFFIRCLDLLTF